MSRQLNSKFTIATLSAMISLLLSAQAAQAATVGSTQVNSSQNEPLSASINVSNIDANNFSAAVAARSVYQQMDMSMNVPVNVQFVKTSDTSGKLILTSSQPVTEPFADVVLVLNENGDQQSLPKTLLLPMEDKVAPPSPQTVTQNVMVGDATNQNLPEVSPPTTQPPTTQNNTVAKNNTSNSSSATDVVDSTPVIDTTPIINTQARSNVARTTPSNNSVNNNSVSNNTSVSTGTTNNNYVPLIAPGNTDVQSDILTTQITRTYRLSNGEVKVVPLQANGQSNTANVTANNTENTNSDSSDGFETLKPAPAFVPSASGSEDNMIEEAIVQASRNDPDAEVVNVNTPDSVPRPQQSDSTESIQAQTATPSTTTQPTSTPSTQPDIGLSDVRYTVQRNDNLWTIANQIARRNHVDVKTVMNQIQTHNQNAFINGDPNLLKASSTLKIPDYDVIPSRLGIRAAMSAQQASRNNADTSSSSSRSTTPSGSSSTNTQARNDRPQRPSTQAIPRPNVTLVTPGNSGTATGNNNRTSSSAQGSGLSSALAARVRATRQQTADEARRVASLNSQLSEYTRKLQLQNQRLSDLEARLRELREQ